MNQLALIVLYFIPAKPAALAAACLVVAGLAWFVGARRTSAGLRAAAPWAVSGALVRATAIPWNGFADGSDPAFGWPLVLATLAIGMTAVIAAAAFWKKPWAAVWCGAAGGIAALCGFVAWGQLDATVVPIAYPFPMCTPVFVSPTAATTLVYGALLGLAAGPAAGLAQFASSWLGARALRRLGAIGLAVVLTTAAVGTARSAVRSQPKDYAMELPVVGSARAMYRIEQGPDQPDERYWPDDYHPAQAFHLDSTDAMDRTGVWPASLTALRGVVHDDSADMPAWQMAGERWDMHFVRFDPHRDIQLRNDAAAGIWLLTQDRIVLASIDDPAPAELTDPELVARRDLLAWPFIADQLAPPLPWVLSAWIGLMGYAALGTARSRSEEGERTLASMQIAVLAATSTPLLVAAVRGFVFAI